MRKGIKEKDIRAFVNAVERLNAVIERIREYCPTAELYLCEDMMCLMTDNFPACREKDPLVGDRLKVESIHMPYCDGGGG